MDNVTYDKMENETASLAANALKMPSWLMEMTEYVAFFRTLLLFNFLRINMASFFLFSLFILYISNVEKINTSNDAKSLKMETFVLIDDQHHLKNIIIKKEDEDM